MSRRDTIIIAVLLNAGLLIVLFATSLKSDKMEESAPAVQVLASNQPEVKEVATAAAPLTPTALPTDEVDMVIKQYVTPQVTNATETEPNFMADLQAIGTPAIPNVPGEATPAVTESVQEPSLKQVKVKKGDVLERIARQNHTSVEELMKANQLTSTRLKIGQTLKIPTKGAKKTAVASVANEGAKFYTIKSGDSPWTIAVKHRMKVEELLKLNQMSEEKARRLKPGDQIRIQ